MASDKEPDVASGPRISILLPARDAALTIDAALASVARQSEREWECVVVDDGSRDATAERVERFARDDPRFRLLRRPRSGLVPALAAGLEACASEWIARMDADDLMHGRRLEHQLAHLATRPWLDGVGCHVRSFPRSGLGRGRRAYEAWLNGIVSEDDVRRALWVECPIAHPTLVARRELYARSGYRDRGWPEDYDLLLRWVLAGRRLEVVPRRLHGWRHGPTRASVASSVYDARSFTACKAEFLAHSFLAAHPSFGLWGYGSTGRELRRELAARGKALAWLVEVHRGRIGQRIHGAPVVSPEQLPGMPRVPLVVSVAGAGPRERITRWLVERGYRETVDFVCAA